VTSILDRLSVLRGDISALDLDAIVNAANAELGPGTGVNGAILRAGGADLGRAMAALGGCPTGEAVVTPGFRLKARLVVHTVAPIFSQYAVDEVWRLLGRCYSNSLSLAVKHGVRRIAFPCLGTGVYGIPAGPACSVAIASVMAHCEMHAQPEQVAFCCYDETSAGLYRAALAKLAD
jgi:O-acetyl-ADP-ribose deacetylase (regulator of RNase III)